MNRSLPRALLIEVEGTIRPRRDGPWLAKACGIESAYLRSEDVDGLYRRALKGEITHQRWSGEVACTLAKMNPGTRIENSAQSWLDSCGEACSELQAVLHDVKRHIKVLAVSNSTTRLREDLGTLGVEALFDAVINSSELGKLKPDREVYRIALAEAASCSWECIYVDVDDGNLQAAELAGMAIHKYTSPERLRRFLVESEAFF
jgi:putative hydrolase of the HAD superfamily